LLKVICKEKAKITEKEQELVLKTKTKDDYLKKLQDIKKKIKVIQNENKDIKNELLVHYHNLLNTGKDSRKDGLMWIVKAIWELGHDVIVSYLPTFLDDKSISFIFQYALKDIELQRIKANIDEIKLEN